MVAFFVIFHFLGEHSTDPLGTGERPQVHLQFSSGEQFEVSK